MNPLTRRRPLDEPVSVHAAGLPDPQPGVSGIRTRSVSALVPISAALAVFLALYAVMFKRAEREGRERRWNWPWLLAIVGLAVAVYAVGVTMR